MENVPGRLRRNRSRNTASIFQTPHATSREGFLQFYSFPEIGPMKIPAMSMSELTIREVRPRCRAVGAFPSIGSWVLLDACCLMEYSEGWPTDWS